MSYLVNQHFSQPLENSLDYDAHNNIILSQDYLTQQVSIFNSKGQKFDYHSGLQPIVYSSSRVNLRFCPG